MVKSPTEGEGDESSCHPERMTNTSMEETTFEPDLDHNGQWWKLRISEETAKYLRECKDLVTRFWCLPKRTPDKKLYDRVNEIRSRGLASGSTRLEIVASYLGIQPVRSPPDPLYQLIDEKLKSKMKDKYAKAATEEEVPPSDLLLDQVMLAEQLNKVTAEDMVACRKRKADHDDGPMKDVVN